MREILIYISNKKVKNLTLFLLIFLGFVFFNVKPAYAFVFDLNSVFLDALDFCDQIIKMIVNIFLMIVVVCIYLNIAAYFLQAVIKIPITLKAGLVLSGWKFILGITNIFMVLAILVIALAYILKIESFQAKKALSRFIIIAILINFSLVFVGMLVDIAHFFSNTMISAFGENFIVDSIQPLISSLINYSFYYIIVVGVYIATAFIPYVNAIALAGLTTWFLIDVVTFGNFAQSIMLLIIGFGIAGIFSFLIFIFLARIAMVWILAIFSPLAFLGYIFPRGEKSTKIIPFFNFDEWLKDLIQWLFVGVIILFLMGLGLKFVSEILANPVQLPPLTYVPFVPSWFFSYIFLFIFLALVQHYSRSYAPAFAATLLSQAKGLVSRGSRMAAPAIGSLKKFGKDTQEFAYRRIAKTKVGKRWAKSLEKAEILEAKGKKKRAAFRRAIGKIGIKMQERAEEFRAEDIEKMKKIIKARPKEVKFSALRENMKKRNVDKALAVAEVLMEEGKLNEAELKGYLQKEDYEKLVKRAKERNRKDVFVYDPSRAVPIIEKEKWERADLLEKEGKDTEAQKLRKEILSSFVQKIPLSQIKQMSEKAFEDENLREAVVNTFSGQQMAEVGKNFGKETVNKIQEGINKMDFQELAKRNPRLAMWLYGNTAQDLGFNLPSKNIGITRRQMKKTIAEQQRETKKEWDAKLGELKKFYEQKEALMFRDYYRKDILDETKEMIRKIVSEKGKVIPPEAHIKALIKEQEKEFKKQTEKLKKQLKETTDPQEQKNLIKIIREAEEDRDKNELEALKKLW